MQLGAGAPDALCQCHRRKRMAKIRREVGARQTVWLGKICPMPDLNETGRVRKVAVPVSLRLKADVGLIFSPHGNR